ncbi:LytTr DNA-binding domain protein [Kordia sp. SMS9]|uniref:LytR/AlgR family response regulator transcription factor n=1 Tax=Kordia sp. SMS9 TaxID=2282170 RepID=UPI000E0D61C9|nr:LytTR family DNA-binding domain-containing protein [Kordia sp. SMS9]AXG71120.1 LytTr DNA-binding domain protein [Kordia sp. SMS9]
MKNYRIYLYTTISFVLVYVLVISLVVHPLTIKYKSIVKLQNTINLATQEIQQVSILSATALENKVPKDTIVNSIQKAVAGSDNESVYLSVFDWSGMIICHPDVTKLRSKNEQKSNTVSNMKSVVTGEELYQHIKNVEESNINASEIIALRPIANSDMILAAHLNIDNIKLQTNSFTEQVKTTYLILGLILLVFLLIIIRVLATYYEQIIERKTAKFEDGVLNLSKLNDSLENYQKSIEELQINTEPILETATGKAEEKEKEVPKQRLLTYIRNELMPISITDISYIYVENSISYVVRKDGKRFTANDSLDQIYTSLDPKLFFRANRQTIVAIYAIDKIIKYGNSALKIEMQPVSEIDIIIGKNKVAVFKKWLDL